MRLWAWLLVGLGVGLAPPAERAFAQAPRVAQTSPAMEDPVFRAASARPRSKRHPRPYEGVWASNRAACRDEDGVDRMAVEANLFQWYETRCRARDTEAEGRRSWTMRMSCEGEGRKYHARPRLSLVTPNRLIMDDAPVGRTRRQVYLRCAGR